MKASKFKGPLRFPVFVGFLVLAGCSRPVNVESKWAEEATRKESFGNLLVVGVSPNYNTRCDYEYRVVADLRTGGTVASTTCAHMDPEDPLTVDNVVPIVAEVGADGVLVTELLGRHDELTEGGSSETRGEAYYKPVGYGYAYRRPYYRGYGHYGLPVVEVEFTAEQSAFQMNTRFFLESSTSSFVPKAVMRLPSSDPR